MICFRKDLRLFGRLGGGPGLCEWAISTGDMPYPRVALVRPACHKQANKFFDPRGPRSRRAAPMETVVRSRGRIASK
jgi:hypothetical protein